ncbi:MAG: 30S ribosomal protein S12 methylthiotransferase RimO [Oscillospiraceae bacterium]|nr:30S ribosomal protein S12 methylthiotransferase RimO [Oscillospiraceae bacterium]
MRTALISLGCSKNLVNSEQMLWLLSQAGHELVDDPVVADAVIVNTCGFLESARAEAVEQILEIAAMKPKTIVVAGCMSERHKNEIMLEIPEVDGVIGCGSFDDVVEVLNEAAEGKRPERFGDINAPVSETPRILGTPQYTAYLKIAEGCDNHCAYCVIPSIRGSFRSRSMDNIINEAKALAEDGARELTLVAQDTTRYGLDLYGKRVLPELIDKLCEIENIHWLRLHYLYPDDVTEELVKTIARQPKCTPYFDIPIQHCGDKLLKSMGRRGNKAGLLRMVNLIRENVPNAVLRTSFIVGLPGETDGDFEELCEFLRQTKWERAGVFEYSAEDDTPAAIMQGQVDEETKSRRREIIEDIRREIMDDFNETLMEETLEILCEGYDRAAGCYFGRSVYDAPEVDGKVFFESGKKVQPGEFVQVKISESIDGDLFGGTV